MESQYFAGFGQTFESEALPGALPKGQNSPQKPPLGLYAEQLSGTPFTSPRKHNFRTWLYKIRPSVVQGAFTEVGHPTWHSQPSNESFVATPQALRFHPYPDAGPSPVDFIDSIFTVALNGSGAIGSGAAGSGCAIHWYACNQSMTDRYFYNADAEMMIVPQMGELRVHTEMGLVEISPLWIGVIPRGVKFRVEVSGPSKGYVLENFGLPFQLPDLGPIGANGLAHERHFETPQAAFEDREGAFSLVARYQGSLWQAPISSSPLNAVAWHGNLAPYRYNLQKFNTIGTVSFDHPDPSIFTVLTAPTSIPGTANVDFVIFPKRWMVAENTFRPPYYHRNVMNEFMGLIQGKYDAKEDGFRPGGASLHNCMTGHGPDTTGFEKATHAQLKPELYDHTMAFMWESCYAFWPSVQALKRPGLLDSNYFECWQTLPKLFSKP